MTKDESKNTLIDTEDCTKPIPSACAGGWVAPLPEPIYNEDGITLYCADCTRVLPLLEPIELLLTDPPYGINFDTDYTRFTSGFGVPRRVHKKIENDNKLFDPAPLMNYPKVIVWGANCYSNRLPMGTWLIWDKRFSNGAAFLADGEAGWMKGGYGIYIYSITSQGFIRPEPIQHPTQKPVGLMEWCIKKAAGDGVILDPYCGSGTTLVAAKRLGRKAIGIEISEKYCWIAIDRLRQRELF